MARTMRELIDLRNRQRDNLPEGRPLDEYSDAQRVEMTKDVAHPEVRNTPTGGTFVRNEDGAASSRAPSPDARKSHYEAVGRHGPDSNEAIEAEASMYGMDPSQYRDPLVLQDADPVRDFDIMRQDVMRERPRRQAIEEDYDSVPAQWDKHGNVVAYKYVPKASTRQRDKDYRDRVALKDLRDSTNRIYGDQILADGQMGDAVDSASRPELLEIRDKLRSVRQRDIARNIRDRQKNVQITRDLNNPDMALGYVIRSTTGVAPHDRAALYTALGWEPAATRETQAGIAQDAYNSQMAMASQQGGATPEDNSVAAQGMRHWKQLDAMIANGEDGIRTAIATHASFLASTNEGMTHEQSVQAAEREIINRMAGRPAMRNDPRVQSLMAEKAREGEDAFVMWAASVGIPAAQARPLYARITRGPAATAGPVNPITGK